MKKFIWLLFSGMMGIILAPEILATAEADEIKAPVFSDPETVVIAPEPVVLETAAPEPVKTVAAATVITTSVTKETPVVRDNITILGRSLPITAVNSTNVDAGNEVKSYKNMLYGHNSGTVFGILESVGVGTTFTVFRDGALRTYRVAENVEAVKVSEQTLSINDQKFTVEAIASRARGHSLVLVTCIGDGATARRLIFADEI